MNQTHINTYTMLLSHFKIYLSNELFNSAIQSDKFKFCNMIRIHRIHQTTFGQAIVGF